MFLQKPLEMQSGEASLQYVLEGCGVISLEAFGETAELSIVVPLKKKPTKTQTPNQQICDEKICKICVVNLCC